MCRLAWCGSQSQRDRGENKDRENKNKESDEVRLEEKTQKEVRKRN